MWDKISNDMSIFPGKTLACVTNDYKLLIEDFKVFEPLLNEKSDEYIHYIGTAEYAKKVGRSPEIIKVLCREGRIIGAKKKSNVWIIPEDAPYPIKPDSRKKR